MTGHAEPLEVIREAGAVAGAQRGAGSVASASSVPSPVLTETSGV